MDSCWKHSGGAHDLVFPRRLGMRAVMKRVKVVLRMALLW
jgi:hypothetical protein